jgi:hypothetical protein
MAIDAENDLSFKSAVEVLSKYGLSYEIKSGASMMWVQSPNGKVYAYYPTTHRWAPRHLKGKHYRAKSTEDFIERFVLKGDERLNDYREVTKKVFNVQAPDLSVSDLVEYCWEEFESGTSKTEVKRHLYKFLWGVVNEQ